MGLCLARGVKPGSSPVEGSDLGEKGGRMKSAEAFLGKSATVFAVLAWLSFAVQVVVGLLMLVFGGEPVAMGGADVPARIASLIVFVGAALNWFLFMFLSKLTRLFVAIHAQTARSAA